MPVRTAWRSGPLVYFSAAAPAGGDSVAIAAEGLLLEQGGVGRVLGWHELAGVEVRLTGVRLACSVALVRMLARFLFWGYVGFAGLLFVVSFGLIGGGGGGTYDGGGGFRYYVDGGLRVKPILAGRPSAYAEWYWVPLPWPVRPTDLEQHWFEAVVQAASNRAEALDVALVWDLLQRASTVEEFRAGLEGATGRQP